MSKMKSEIGWHTCAVPAIIAAITLSCLSLGGCNGSTTDTEVIAELGEDLNLLVGKPIQLDGSRSRDIKGRALQFQWSLVEKPALSLAEIQSSIDARPVFTPDHPGQYKFELRVSAGSAVSEPAKMAAAVYYAPSDFLYLDSRVVQGDALSIGSYAINLGLKPPRGPGQASYPAPAFTSYSGDPIGFQVLVIKRSDGSIVSHKSYPLHTQAHADAIAADINALGTGQDKLVIVSSLEYPASAMIFQICTSSTPGKSNLDLAMQSLGASTSFMGVGKSMMNPQLSESYTLVGINGLGAGNGYERWVFGTPDLALPSANVSGKLVRDYYQQFGFTYDYVPFETRTTSTATDIPVNSITIGDSVYPLPSEIPDDISGGFHVLVLNRETLQMISQKLYIVNLSGVPQNEKIIEMGADLYPIAKKFEYLVIISSVGVLPTIRNFGSDAAKVEQAIDLLGGTPGVFPHLTTNDTYGLVGIGPGDSYSNLYWRLPDPNFPIVSVDASSVKDSGIEANIRGLLKKDHQGWFTPYLSDGGGETAGIDYSLVKISLQDPVAWRGPDTDDEKKVYADISKNILHGLSVTHPDDMRLYYYQDLGWSSLYTKLYALTCQTLYTTQCDSATTQAFTTMWTYLEDEVLKRNQLQDWFNNDLTQLINGLSKTDAIDLHTAYTNALQLTEASDTKETAMKTMEVLKSVLEVVAKIGELVGAPVGSVMSEDSKIGTAVGLVVSIIGLVMEFIPSPSKDAPGVIKEAAADLWQDMLETYIDTTANINQAFLYITGDWGRLEAFHSIYLSLYDYTQYKNVLDAMEPGFTAYFYQVLIPLLYHIEPMPLVPAELLSDCTTSGPCDWYTCNESGHVAHAERNNCLSDYTGYHRPSDAVLAIENLSYAPTPCSASKPRRSYYTAWKDKSGLYPGTYYSDGQIKLFTPVESGGLGVSKMEFFTRWPFTYEYSTHWDGGCNCNPPTQICPQ